MQGTIQTPDQQHRVRAGGLMIDLFAKYTPSDTDLVVTAMADGSTANLTVAFAFRASADDLTKWLGGEVQEGLCDPDAVPEPPDAATTHLGDLWILARMSPSDSRGVNAVWFHRDCRVLRGSTLGSHRATLRRATRPDLQPDFADGAAGEMLAVGTSSE